MVVIPGSMVVVAMSGGVDSSVAAAILKERGHEVVGIGLRLVDEADSNDHAGSCCGAREMEDARRVAETIGIPFYVWNFKDAFRKHVVEYFTSSYLNGETPNPCIPCNEVIKFDKLLRAAMGLGAGFLATGHYARVELEASRRRYILRKGVDGSKDQSYFLYSLSQEQLERALFPMGGTEKSRARGIARSLGLKVHDKPESQDVCFVGTEGYAAFISGKTKAGAGPGPILSEAGSLLGTHSGLHHYTIGQRRGLGISSAGPMYVIDIDPARNSITAAPGDRVRRQKRVLLERMNYVSISEPPGPIEVEVMTGYRRPVVPATCVRIDEKHALVEFHSARKPTAPGQSVVMYQGDKLICGGIVKREG